MRVGTLFSGIGAAEQGFMRHYGDIEHVFACEWDKFARQSFKAIYDIDDKHFYEDISDMDGTQYKGKVDVIIGGSPCQDFSIAGLRAGIEGHRGQLIWQYYRIIKEIMPPIFIYENVKGMVSDKNGQTLKDFLEVFRDLGYYCHSEVLNTKDYGVPQNRERIYIVGFLDHERYYRFNYAPKQKLERFIEDIIQYVVDDKYYLNADNVKYYTERTIENQAKGNGFSFKPHRTGKEVAFAITNPGKNRIDDNFLDIGSIKRYHMITWYEEKQIRKLTPLECWRLQDFPDEAHNKAEADGVSNSQRYKQAGNSMSVNVIEMLAREIEATNEVKEGCLF